MSTGSFSRLPLRYGRLYSALTSHFLMQSNTVSPCRRETNRAFRRHHPSALVGSLPFVEESAPFFYCPPKAYMEKKAAPNPPLPDDSTTIRESVH